MKRRSQVIDVKDIEVSIRFDESGDEFISLTDIARFKNPNEPTIVVANWMRNRSSIEFLGLWEKLHNPDFKGIEFDTGALNEKRPTVYFGVAESPDYATTARSTEQWASSVNRRRSPASQERRSRDIDMNVFKERKFYPNEDTPIKEHYAGTFDSVFLAFLPFFRIDEAHLNGPSFKRVHQITYPQFKSAHPDLSLPENISADIYSNDNPDYPTDGEILRHATPVTWSEVKAGCGFDSLAEIDKALTTSNGSYRAVFRRQDLVDRLLQYAEQDRIFLPEDGTFGVLSKLSILNTFRKLGKGFIVVEDELLDKRVTLDIRELSDEEFCNKIEYKDYYIYDIDEEILFAIDWDDFFFLIAAPPPIMKLALANDSFEGFECDETFKTYWELGDDELQAGLAKEATMK